MQALKRPSRGVTFLRNAVWSARRAEHRWRVIVRVRSAADASAENGEPFVIGKIARRTLLVSFKCNVCQTRTDRLVNPHAWNNGTVFVQCKNCENWHRIRDNLNLIDEIRYSDET